jgi:hypothetical protein
LLEKIDEAGEGGGTLCGLVVCEPDTEIRLVELLEGVDFIGGGEGKGHDLHLATPEQTPQITVHAQQLVYSVSFAVET